MRFNNAASNRQPQSGAACGAAARFFPAVELVENFEDFANDERICFVNANTGNIAEEILLQPVEARLPRLLPIT